MLELSALKVTVLKLPVWKTIAGAMVLLLSVSAPAWSAELAGSEWAMKKKPERFITFNAEGRVSGFSGCNRFTGTYVLKGKRLSFGPIAGTRKMCAPEIMKAEQKFLAALGSTVRMKRTKRNLKLWNKTGKRVLKLRPRGQD